jgi:hypothetical protein
MTSRDRMMLTVMGLAAVVAAFWFLAISPRRAESTKLDGQITQARQARDTALQTANAALAAQRGHGSDEAIIARLGKAVPSDDDTASLLYQLDTAAGRSHVNFKSVKLTGSTAAPAAAPAATTAGGDAAAAATQAAAAPLPPGATIGEGGISKLSFTLAFEGTFFDLGKFLRQMHSFTSVDGNKISVRGRLLAVDGISLAAAKSGFPQVTASLSVSAFLAAPASLATAPAPPAAGTGSPPDGSASLPPTTPATIVGVGG